MSDVLRALRRPLLRPAVIALALSASMIFGGTALAGLPARLARQSNAHAQPAAVTNVKLLGKKTVTLSTGHNKVLLTVGAVTTRVVCISHGGSDRELQIQAKSTAADTVAASSNGAAAIGSSYVAIWIVRDTTRQAFAQSYDILIGTNGFTHYLVDYSINGTANCGARLAALSD